MLLGLDATNLRELAQWPQPTPRQTVPEVATSARADDQLASIFDAGRLIAAHAEAIHIADSEIDAFAFVDEIEAARRLRPYVWCRLRAALDAVEDRQTRYLRDGRRVVV